MRLSRPAIALLGMAALAGCQNGAPMPDAQLSSEARDSSGVRTVTLSHSPTAIARGSFGAVEIRPDLVIGGGPDPLGFPLDVAPLADGAFAVLDGLLHEIRVLDSRGAAIRRFGRRGRGPGDLRWPVAIARAGGQLILLQGSREATLAAFSGEGRVLATSPAPVPGDWDRTQRNQPIFGPVTRGPEDFTRRIVGIPGGFLHVVQEREGGWQDEFPWRQPPALLIRYDTVFHVVDTVARLHGGELRVRMATGMNRATGETFEFPEIAQPFFPATPVWAATGEWIAIGHGDSSRIVVRGMEGDPVSVVRWPGDRVPISEGDRREAAKWMLAYQCVMSVGNRERCEAWANDRAKSEEGVQFTIGHTTFAEHAPLVVAAYGAARCLFIAGHSPADFVDGTALTWLALHVRTGNLEGLFRFVPRVGFRMRSLNRRGGAVRAIDGRNAYVATINSDGESFIERFPLPPLGCVAPAPVLALGPERFRGFWQSPFPVEDARARVSISTVYRYRTRPGWRVRRSKRSRQRRHRGIRWLDAGPAARRHHCRPRGPVRRRPPDRPGRHGRRLPR